MNLKIPEKIVTLKTIFQIIITAVVYFITAKFGLGFDAVSGFATLVWPPTGICLALTLLWGYKIWPGIFLGAFLANQGPGAVWFVPVGIGIGNTLEAMAGVY